MQYHAKHSIVGLILPPRVIHNLEITRREKEVTISRFNMSLNIEHQINLHRRGFPNLLTTTDYENEPHKRLSKNIFTDFHTKPR